MKFIKIWDFITDTLVYGSIMVAIFLALYLLIFWS